MGRWSRELARELVRFAGVHDGDAVLDVGSGTGALAGAVGEAMRDGSVRGIDASADYVALATRASSDPRIGFEVGDACSLPFPDASFDRTLSLLALNFVPDPARAAAEMARVTKPAGTVAVALWDYGDGMQMLRVFWDEAVSLDPSCEPFDERHAPLTKPGELGAMLRTQGLGDVENTTLEIELPFTSFYDYWQPFLLGQGPAGAHVAKLSEGARATLEARLHARLGDRPHMRARAWAARGTR